MKIVAPDYYRDFSCIAGNCKHSCCKGWEIDIDEETAEYYKNLPGNFGEKLRKNIDFGEACSCFRLSEDERCPFLNEHGLCDIIINLGEDSLCQICSDHPRFRNFFESRTEIGLGLCCEAAAMLILDKKEKTVLEVIDDDGNEEETGDDEKAFFALRDAVFAVLQNRDLPVCERIDSMLGICGGSLPEKNFAEWAEVYKGLERLDDSWMDILEHADDFSFRDLSTEPVAAEQLLCYFVFRHLGEGLYDGRIAERAAFAVLSYYMTAKAAESAGIHEAARLYSSEIEYSDENIEALLDYLSAENEV